MSIWTWRKGRLHLGGRANLREWAIGGSVGYWREIASVELDLGPVGGWVELRIGR